MKKLSQLLHRQNEKIDLFYAKLLSFLDANLVTRRFLSSIYSRYELLYGMDGWELKRKTARLALVLLFSFGLLFFLILGRRPTYFTLVSAIFISYVIHMEILASTTRNIEIKLLVQMRDFISSVRHYFFISHDITIAVWEAMEMAKKELRPQLLHLYHCLCDEDVNESVVRYQGSHANRYLKTFLAFAVHITIHGDVMTQEGSVFSKNLILMKEDIHRDLREIKKSEFLFSGASFLLLLPILMMPLIKVWAYQTFPEVVEVYQSTYGVFVEAIALLITVLLYQYLNDLKTRNHFQFSNHSILKKITSVYRVQQLLGRYFDKRNAKFWAQRDVLRQIGENHTIETLFLSRCFYAIGMCLFVLILFLMTGARELLKPYSWGICLVVGICGYWYPYMVMHYRKELIANRMQEEVLEFQSLIYMQMHLQGIDGRGLLLSLEQHSSIFKNSLRICINQYNNDDFAALSKLRQEEKYPPFQQLVDCFLMVNEIGIVSAFEEISSELHNFREDRKVEREILLEKKTQKAILISLVPFVLVLFLYLMGPLVYISIKLLGQTLVEFNDL